MPKISNERYELLKTIARYLRDEYSLGIKPFNDETHWVIFEKDRDRFEWFTRGQQVFLHKNPNWPVYNYYIEPEKREEMVKLWIKLKIARKSNLNDTEMFRVLELVKQYQREDERQYGPDPWPGTKIISKKVPEMASADMNLRDDIF